MGFWPLEFMYGVCSSVLPFFLAISGVCIYMCVHVKCFYLSYVSFCFCLVGFLDGLG